MKAEITKTDYIGQFREAFARGIDGLTEAAQIYVAAVDENPEWHGKFRTEMANLPATVWGTMERVGRGTVHPLLLPFWGNKNYSVTRSLPMSEQSKIASGGKLDMVTADGDVLKVDFRSLTKDQARQVVGDGHIRDASEQRAIMMKRKKEYGPNGISDAQPIPYYITNGKVTFRANVTMTIRELSNIMKIMRADK
jgi:hypothetical protein